MESRLAKLHGRSGKELCERCDVVVPHPWAQAIHLWDNFNQESFSTGEALQLHISVRVHPPRQGRRIQKAKRDLGRLLVSRLLDD